MPIDTQRVKGFYQRVLDWNTVAGNDELDLELAKEIYIKLCQEEYEEGIEAFDEKNSEEMLDSVIDQMVVGYYYFNLCCGSDLEDECIETRYKDHYPSYGKMFKSVEDDTPDIYISYLETLCNTLKDNYQVDIEGAMDEVMRSNFSKFVPDDKVPGGPTGLYTLQGMIQTIYGNCQGRYKGIYAERCGDYYVFRDENKKIMKGPYFEEPNLEPFVGNLDKFFEDMEKENTNKTVVEEINRKVSPETLEFSLLNALGYSLDDLMKIANKQIDDITFVSLPEDVTLSDSFIDLVNKDRTTSDPYKYTMMFSEREMDILKHIASMTLTKDGVSQDLYRRFAVMMHGEDNWQGNLTEGKFYVYDVEADREYPYMWELREDDSL